MAKKIPLVLFSIAALFFSVNYAEAATFELNPENGSFDSGGRFTVDVLINSKGVAVNSAEGVISFNTRYLTIEKISTEVSILKFWVQEPTFSNAAGTISFGGGLPTPGFNGPNGKIFRITFLTAGVGESSLKFLSGAILANDGVGTNILTSSDEGRYTIGPVKVAPQAVPVIEAPGEVPLPVVIFETHPDEEKWWNNNIFKALWKLPTGVTGVNYAFSNNQNYELPARSKGLLKETSFSLEEFRDGAWYFFARFRSDEGWGKTASRKVLVDRQAPDFFEVRRVDLDDSTSAKPVINFETQDDASGVAFYQVKVGDSDWLDVAGPEYKLSPRSPGDHKILVRAFDGAGNYRESSLQVTVEPPSGAKRAGLSLLERLKKLAVLPWWYFLILLVAVFLIFLALVFVFTHQRAVKLQSYFIGKLNYFESRVRRDFSEIKKDLGTVSDEVVHLRQVAWWVFVIIKLFVFYSILMVGSIIVLGSIAIASFFTHSRVTGVLRKIRKSVDSGLRHLEKEENDSDHE